MNYVLNLYKTIKGKQVFLTFDGMDKIKDPNNLKYLKESTVLSLSEGEGALFGKEFNIKQSEQ